LGCGYSGDAEVSLHLGVAQLLYAPVAVDTCEELRYFRSRREKNLRLPLGNMILADAIIGSALKDSPWSVLLALTIWALMNCLLGYFLFRILLVVHCLILAVLLGSMLAPAIRSATSFVDYLIVCGLLGGLLGGSGWFASRIAFAVICGIFGGWGMVSLIAAGDPQLGSWFLGIMTGIVLGVACLSYTRKMVIFLSGAVGGFGAVLCGMSLTSALMPPKASILVLLILLGASLGILGMFCQVKLVQVIGSAMTPEAARNKPPRPGKQVHPRFIKI